MTDSRQSGFTVTLATNHELFALHSPTVAILQAAHLKRAAASYGGYTFLSG